MPPLNLASWEIPEGIVDSPHGEAHAAHFIPWIDGPCMVLFRCVEISYRKWVIFARAANSQEEGNWLVCNTDLPSLIVNRDESYWSTPAPDFEPIKYIEDLVKSLYRADSPLTFGRSMVIEAEGQQHWALLIPMESCQWMQWESLTPSAQFELSEPIEFSEDVAQLRARLYHELSRPDSDASFALRWTELSPDEKSELLCGGKERIAEIEAVLRWTLQSQKQFWKNVSAWELQLLGKPHLLHISYSSTRTARPESHDFSPLYDVARLLVETQIDTLAASLRERYTSPRSYPAYVPASDYRWGKQDEGWAYVRVYGPPTAHEYLEAKLRLREWLQSHASQEEFAEWEKHLD
ncbi:hypothetical protein EON83_20445 [bacterium]|nr:MAG: hypothetical protein EON83_20445 [bacterium]